ncbi:MAG: hypothetical protein P1U86_03150 [Verrucomicrobiales bacterium]|nr:hypothetical protein [Verrucomicrobiales bacterium]
MRRNASTMNTFTINKTDFGIDLEESSASIETVDGVDTLTLEINGDEAVHDAISEDEDSEWSWTAYPPRLYLYEFPMTREGDLLKATLTLDDLNEYEAAIYMMEHNDMDGVEISLNAKGELRIEGTVFLLGETHPFSILYQMSENAA